MYPDRTGLNDDAQLRAICDEEIEIARENYDIRTEYDLARFMEYRIYLGPDFDLTDWIYAILISPESSKIKMNKLDEGFSPRYWGDHVIYSATSTKTKERANSTKTRKERAKGGRCI